MHKALGMTWLALYALGLSACDSNLKVTTSNTNNVSNSDPTSSGVPDDDSLILSVKDGLQVRNTNEFIVVLGDTLKDGPIKIIVAADKECQSKIGEFTSVAELEKFVSIDRDGAYYLCAYRVLSNGEEVLVSTNSLSITIDTKPPQLTTTTPIINASGAFIPQLTIEDTTQTTISWQKVNGPGNVIFSNSAGIAPSVTMSADGVYTIVSVVTDALGQSSELAYAIHYDSVANTTVTLDPITYINAVTQNAVTLSGTCSESGRPVVISGAVAESALCVGIIWTKTIDFSSVSDGNITVNIDHSDVFLNTATTVVANLTKDVIPPNVNAGANETRNALFTTNATTTDGATYLWTKESGTGTITFGSPNTEDTTVVASVDGVYVLRLTVSDAAGNTAYDALTLTWNTTGPVVNVGSDVAHNASFTADATTSGAISYQWTKISGSGVITFGSDTAEDTTISANTDDVYVIRLTATDAASNVTFDEFTLTWDTAAPTVNAGADQTKNALFTINATTAGAGSYSWTQQSGPSIVTFGSSNAEDTTVTASVDGVYVLRLTATDAAGNSAYDEMSLTWDTTAPTIDVGADLDKNALFTINATTSGANTYSWTRQSGPGTITFGTASAEDTTVTASAEGTYVLRLTITDVAGNSAFDELTLNWDVTPPVVNIGADLLKNALFSIDASTTGAASYTWSQQSGPGTITFGTGATEDTTVSASTDGTYVLRLTVIDAAGNSANDEMTLTWDASAPTVDAGTDQIKNALFTINATTSGGSSYAWSKVSGPGSITFGSAAAEDTTVTASADGTYVLRLTVADAAGNITVDEMTLTWDQTDPTVDVGADVTKNALFTIDANTAGGATYLWSKQSGPGTITFGSGSAEDTTITASVDGSYVLRLTVTDAAGNSANDEMTLTWDSTLPTVDVGTNLAKNALFTIDATTSGGTTYTWTKQSGPGSITFGSANAEDTTVSADTDGTYVLRLTVSDGGGNTAYDEMTLIWDTAPPTVNVGLDLLKGSLFTLDASTGGGATYAWTKQSGPGTITFGSANAEDTTATANTEGAYVLRLTVTDAAGNSAYDELNLTWDTTPPTVNVGADLSKNALFTIDATSANGATYAWTKQSGPGTITFGTASAEDTTVTASAEGTYVLRLTVTDGAGNNANDEMTLIWDTTPPTVNVGVDLSKNALFSIDASSANGTTYAWTKQSGPGTITFGTASAEDTTVTASSEGTYVLRLTVTDAASNSAYDELTLIWDTTAPTVNVGANVAANAIYSINASTSGGSTFAWSKQVGAGAITFGSSSSEDTTVTASTQETFTLRLTVTDAAGNSAYDELDFTWDTTAPTVNAGANLCYFVNLGQAIDATTGGGATYSWSKTAGPGTCTFTPNNAEDTSVSCDTAGSYTLQLTVTDAATNSANDSLTYTVNSGGTSGMLDTCFGLITTDFGANAENAKSVGVQADGKIILGGGTNSDFAIARYSTDGTLDTSFSGDGKLTTNFGGSDGIATITLDSNGKIVAGGTTSLDFGIARYNTDGSLDTSFSTDGMATMNFNGTDYLEDIVVQADNKIVAVAQSINGSYYDFGIVRFAADGTADTATFSGDAKVPVNFSGTHDGAYSVALQSDGKIVVVGYAHNGTNYDFGIVRLTTTGALDTAFSTDGKDLQAFGTGSDTAHTVLVQPDGKIIVVGDFANGATRDIGVIRYLTDGTLDTTFSGDGKATFVTGATAEFKQRAVLQSDGKIVIATSVASNYAVVRLNSDGSPDTTFDGDGMATFDFFGGVDNPGGIALDTNGDIIVAGGATNAGNEDFAFLKIKK